MSLVNKWQLPDDTAVWSVASPMCSCQLPAESSIVQPSDTTGQLQPPEMTVKYRYVRFV